MATKKTLKSSKTKVNKKRKPGPKSPATGRVIMRDGIPVYDPGGYLHPYNPDSGVRVGPRHPRGRMKNVKQRRSGKK